MDCLVVLSSNSIASGAISNENQSLENLNKDIYYNKKYIINNKYLTPYEYVNNDILLQGMYINYIQEKQYLENVTIDIYNSGYITDLNTFDTKKAVLVKRVKINFKKLFENGSYTDNQFFYKIENNRIINIFLNGELYLQLYINLCYSNINNKNKWINTIVLK